MTAPSPEGGLTTRDPLFFVFDDVDKGKSLFRMIDVSVPNEWLAPKAVIITKDCGTPIGRYYTLAQNVISQP
jgi:hypothetical protein